MNDDIMQTYSFTYTDCDGKVYTKTISTPGATWHECMDDFVKFLESVFGYPIKPQVRLGEPKWLDPWTGEYFVKEVKEDEEGAVYPPDYTDEWKDWTS